MVEKTNQTTDELSVNASNAKTAKSAAKGKTGAKTAKSGAKAGVKTSVAKSKAAADKVSASKSTAGSKAQTGAGARRGRPPKAVAASADDDKLTANVGLSEADKVNAEAANTQANAEKIDASAESGIATLPLTEESKPVAAGEADVNASSEESRVVSSAPNAEAAEPKRKKSAAEITMFWVSIGLCVLMLPLLLMNIVLIFKSIIHPNDLPTIFGYKPLIVLSDSMYPTIKKGDLIFTQVVDVKDLKPGDVITYREYEDDGKTLGTVVTHKIYDITTETDGEHAGQLKFRTYGINNQRQADGTIKYNEDGEMVVINMDDAVYAPQIEGRYTSKINGLGSFIYWMQGTWGLIVCIGIPLVAFIVYEFIKRNEEIKAQRASNASATNELEELRKKLADLEKKDQAGYTPLRLSAILPQGGGADAGNGGRNEIFSVLLAKVV